MQHHQTPLHAHGAQPHGAQPHGARALPAGLASLPATVPLLHALPPSGGVLGRLGWLRYRIVFSALPVVAATMAVRAGLESNGFTGLIPNSSVTPFTYPAMLFLGFLFQGVLIDYQEGEKIPGIVANAIDSMSERISFVAALVRAKDELDPAAEAAPFDALGLQAELLEYLTCVFEYLIGLRGHQDVMALSSAVGQTIAIALAAVEDRVADTDTWAIFGAVEALRGAFVRVAVMKRTEFNAGGHTLMQWLTAFVAILFTIADYSTDAPPDSPTYITTVYMSIFVYNFLFVYFLFLYEDLEDPFEYS